jgi:hypothetical protein
LAPWDEVPDRARAPEGELMRSELRAVIDRVIVELPASYRAVVLLRDLEELTTEETAQILDLGIDVVKTRLHRGRAAMRQKLDCYLNNHCLEDQPSPNPAPLTPAERGNLYSIWEKRVVVPRPVT